MNDNGDQDITIIENVLLEISKSFEDVTVC